MCRLFGFRSVIPSQVHRSLLSADNALGTQSGRHPDGWGVAFYVDGAPHVTRSPTTALNCALFHRVSGVVSSETVLAHVRKATQGEPTILNCHPFQHGRFTFAHNGDIPSFGVHRERLLEAIAPRLRRFVLGDTDSEVVFFLFLTHLAEVTPLTVTPSAADLSRAIIRAVNDVRAICDGSNEKDRALLTILVTDGVTMAAHQGGKELFYSTYKTRCADRDTCESLSPSCEAASDGRPVNHLVFSSEPILGENVWLPLEEGEIIAVDARMKLVRGSSVRHTLAVVAE
ncbi:MAG: class II glutamine amidotransferase [Polyangiaceae bacterium]|nr:class II glutamine amidotransferase [Polyangiaceae bacterium]